MLKVVGVMLALSIPCSAFASVEGELLLRTALGVKAILAEGHDLETIVDVMPAEMQSTPPRKCVMVVTTREPNVECPEDPSVGPTLDQGFAACMNPKSGVVDHVQKFKGMCMRERERELN